MEEIKATIQNVIQALVEKKKKAELYDFDVLLKKLLTKKEIKHIKFNNFKNGILNFKVDSSAWLYQFNLKKDGLLAGLQQEVKGLKDIRLWMGEF